MAEQPEEEPNNTGIKEKTSLFGCGTEKSSLMEMESKNTENFSSRAGLEVSSCRGPSKDPLAAYTEEEDDEEDPFFNSDDLVGIPVVGSESELEDQDVDDDIAHVDDEDVDDNSDVPDSFRSPVIPRGSEPDGEHKDSATEQNFVPLSEKKSVSDSELKNQITNELGKTTTTTTTSSSTEHSVTVLDEEQNGNEDISPPADGTLELGFGSRSDSFQAGLSPVSEDDQDLQTPEICSPVNDISIREKRQKENGGHSSKKTVTVQDKEKDMEPRVITPPDCEYQEPLGEAPREADTGDSMGSSFIPDMKIKDEPVDEEYEKALAPHSGLIDKIKDEPDNAEEYNQQQKTQEELRISAVFSVTGSPVSSQYSHGVMTSSTARNVPSSLPLKPVLQSTNPSVSSPAGPASPAIRVSCSGCKKILQKGQTAYQRKGSTQLFCSTLCLTGYTVPPLRPIIRKTCHYCLKEIQNPKDVIIAPVDNIGTMKDFCSQACLTAFDFKRKTVQSTVSNEGVTIKCSMCQKTAIIRHEVNYQNVVHKLCSDTCFSKFRSANNLTMNCCENCGGYCYGGTGQCHMLQIEGQAKKFCSSSCITAYKQKSAKITPCTVCRALRSSAEMVENTNSQGKTELFCSVNCLSAYRVQSVTTSGVQVTCNGCKCSAVPQYHLAMSDGSIRNFCSYNCVVNFQNMFNKPSGQSSSVVPLSQGQVIVSMPSAPGVTGGGATVTTTNSSTAAVTQGTMSTPAMAGLQRLAVQSQQAPMSRAVIKLRCQHCHRLFSSKPEVLDFKGRMLQFCGKTCFDEFKKVSFVMARCEYCKIEKIVKETIKFNKLDRSFCSEGCKLLYKHDLAKRWGSHCRCCTYCTNASQKVVQNHFAGKLEEFCSEECMSMYTVLFYQMAKCDTCKRQGKLIESLKWHGDMKHFCNLQCLLHFCSQHCSTDVPSSVVNTVATSLGAPAPSTPAAIGPQIPTAMPAGPLPPLPPPLPPPPSTVPLSPLAQKKEATPVIANVVSLASTPTAQPSINSNTALQGAVPTVQAKIIGDASTQTDTLKLPPSAPPRILKNKALLCKPISQTKATSCKPHTQNKECQTEDVKPEVIVLPIPVPVFVPVPLNFFTQYTPYPFGIPVPLPVPMFIPTTLDSADKIIETIQDIKEKIPSNPFEADLLQMAEMIAEEEEKEKPTSHGDQGSTYSGDLESEAVSTPHSWEDELNHYALRSSGMQEPDPELRQLSQMDLEQDLEADFPLDLFDPFNKDISITPRQRNRRRPRDGFPPRKRGRKRASAVVSSGISRGSLPATPEPRNTLKYMYGVNAWRNWVQWRNTQTETEELRFGARPVKPKEDILQCSSAELSYGLCQFIKELRRPSGDKYSPDSVFYLCLGIQQYLFENGRIENIFTDLFYSKFTMEITKMLKSWKPTVLPSGYLHSRVEEEYLWECKQLGAYSPIVLLNTLLFFNTKLFQLKTIRDHQRLSFAHVMRCTKTLKHNAKMTYLRFFPPAQKKDPSEKGLILGKRKLGSEEEEEEVMEMAENTDNPLRCPVRLYEFYLSKCSDSVKQRTDVFYLQPERSCVPNSPLWYSSLPIDPETLETMLTRILMVREVHEELKKAKVDSNSDEGTSG
ncbi:zinc finger MYM-type protein 4 [Erpetoichthys calabaricus]|uniref:zinc finger MYM-type protein 4 n=1 Tax=Erpetoichthys calabaricus TaxID=27687 RepID=UPI002234E2EB|nr:zinc finger MYM-type protein 4 [Erpetoichthys calabaricus]